MAKKIFIVRPRNMNSYLEHIKVELSFAVLQTYLKTWLGKQCMCNLCKFIDFRKSGNNTILTNGPLRL